MAVENRRVPGAEYAEGATADRHLKAVISPHAGDGGDGLRPSPVSASRARPALLWLSLELRSKVFRV